MGGSRSRKPLTATAGDALGGAAAQRALGERLDAIVGLLNDVADRGASPGRVHRLRVATRRAGAALETVGPWLDAGASRRTRGAVRSVRKSAGTARDCDVQHALLKKMRKKSPGALAAGLDAVVERAEQESKRARGALRRSALRRAERLRDASGSLWTGPDSGGASLGEAAQRSLPGMIRDLRDSASADLRSLDAMHQLRIGLKRLRYGLEVLAPSLDPERLRRANARLRDLQDHLGAINDLRGLMERIEQAWGERGLDSRVKKSLAALARRIARERDRQHGEFLKWWPGFGSSDVVRTLLALTPALASEEAGPRGFDLRDRATRTAPGGEVGRPFPGAEVMPAHQNGSAAPPRRAAGRAQRLAAIDVGTNSIRLIIAEAAPGGTYRILDDEKENTRLGRGLAGSGRMMAESMRRSAETIAHMKRIAEGYGVQAIRVVGTAVVREASNRAAFASMVRERTGLRLETISGEEEARLAHLSAAHHFDLHSTNAAVVDIGGGSVEVVLSSGGVVEQVATAPLGAVRLTERFGGPEAAAGGRFDEMRDHISREIRRALGKTPFTPQVLIGTGGTNTTLANISLERRRGSAGPEAGPPGVRGYEMMRSEVRHLLDWLRKTPLRERARLPGLPADRADIIVAGVAVIERLMKRLNVNRIRIHDGGIREGILLTMLEERREGGAQDAEGRRDPLASARKMAEACGYEDRHCNHVAHLAGRIFDQVAAHCADEAPLWTTPRNRTLLQAAAILKDIGYHINYSKHHRHSYHLIVHGDLRGLTPREVDIVANVARYHRRAEPKMGHRNYARLSPTDRGLVRGLAAILRVADGLDRTHMGNVRDVTVRIDRGVARFTLEAEASPEVEIWGAVRKAGLFERVFRTPARFHWRPDAVDQAPAPAGASTAARRSGRAPLMRMHQDDDRSAARTAEGRR